VGKKKKLKINIDTLRSTGKQSGKSVLSGVSRKASKENGYINLFATSVTAAKFVDVFILWI